MPSYLIYIKQYGVKTFLRREEGDTRENVVRSVETQLGIRERGVVTAQEFIPPGSSDTDSTADSSFSSTAGSSDRAGQSPSPSSTSPDEGSFGRDENLELEFLKEQNKSKMYDTILSSIDFLSDVAKRVIEAKKAAKF
jgi:hypothetical protein